MRWITNTYDPSKPDAWISIIPLPGQTHKEAEESHKKFLRNKIIARPKATDAFTVEQLEAMDMVGVYVSEFTGRIG